MTGYIDLQEAAQYLRIGDGDDNTFLQGLIDTSSQMIDLYCGRQFTADDTATARVYSTEWPDIVSVDDISTTDGLIVKTDQNDTGTFDVTWAATDYQLEPVNWLSQGRAVYTIRSTRRGNWFPASDTARVQVTAKWGWPSVPDQVRSACLLQVARLNMRRQAPGGVIVVPDMDTTERLIAAIDPDARVLLAPLRRGEWLP